MDHSYVQTLVDRGELTEEEANVHPQSNILMGCLGAEDDPPTDLHFIPQLRPGDVLMACSDGVWHYFNPSELGSVLSSLSPREATEFLIEKARSRGHGRRRQPVAGGRQGGTARQLTPAARAAPAAAWRPVSCARPAACPAWPCAPWHRPGAFPGASHSRRRPCRAARARRWPRPVAGEPVPARCGRLRRARHLGGSPAAGFSAARASRSRCPSAALARWSAPPCCRSWARSSTERSRSAARRLRCASLREISWRRRSASAARRRPRASFRQSLTANLP